MSYAIAMKTGPLEEAIHQFKFRGKWGWGMVFARVLNGYLYENSQLLESDAIIIPSPAYVPASASVHDDHARWVVQQAAEEDDQGLPYVWDPPLVVKTKPTRKLKSLGGSERSVERNAIRDSLVVPESARLNGRTIWVFDDVFTTGSTLDAVAEVLKHAGAASVFGLTLSRQPYW